MKYKKKESPYADNTENYSLQENIVISNLDIKINDVQVKHYFIYQQAFLMHKEHVFCSGISSLNDERFFRGCVNTNDRPL